LAKSATMIQSFSDRISSNHSVWLKYIVHF
jgi:hypothetical protein